MKALNKSLCILLTIAAAATVVSCDPLEPSTYYEQLFRIGTVRYNKSYGTVSILFDSIYDDGDKVAQVYALDNFRSKNDMDAFGVKDSDRVIAIMDFNAVGTMYNANITVSSLKKIDVRKFETKRPDNTLDWFYSMRKLTMANVEYPEIWSTGHIVNIAPVYYAPSGSTAEFYLDLVGFRHDTLFSRLYSKIPESDMGIQKASQAILCFDISSIRETSADVSNQEIRSSVISGLEGMHRNSFTFTVMTPDSMRTKYNETDMRVYPGFDYSKSVPVKFDF